MLDETIAVLRQGFKDLLPDSVVVDISPPFEAPWDLCVHLRDLTERIALNTRIGRGELPDLIESDWRGLDAQGLDGLDAMLMHVAMAIDSNYDGEIPPFQSGIRLSQRGKCFCDLIVDKWNRSRSELLSRC